MEQLIDAVLTWLKGAGFQAVRRMPEGEFPELSGAVVAVGLGKAEATDAGLYSYLGVTEIDGKAVSLYGKRLETQVTMEVVSPENLGAKACMEASSALLTKLSGGIPGLAIAKTVMEGCRFEADMDCYCCKMTVTALAYIYALANEDETEFTDFMLKGEVR